MLARNTIKGATVTKTEEIFDWTIKGMIDRYMNINKVSAISDSFYPSSDVKKVHNWKRSWVRFNIDEIAI